MYENEKIELKDIWASDWAVVQQLIIQREIYKQEVAEQSERIARLAGKSPNKNAQKFPTLR